MCGEGKTESSLASEAKKMRKSGTCNKQRFSRKVRVGVKKVFLKGEGGVGT